MTEVNTSNFEKEVTEHKGFRLIQFYGAACVLCRMNKQILINNEERLGMKLCLVNAQDNPELTGEYSVTSIPTVIVQSPSGINSVIQGNLQGGELVKAIKHAKQVLSTSSI